MNPEVMGLGVAQRYRVQIRDESRTSPLSHSKGTPFNMSGLDGKLGILSSISSRLSH